MHPNSCTPATDLLARLRRAGSDATNVALALALAACMTTRAAAAGDTETPTRAPAPMPEWERTYPADDDPIGLPGAGGGIVFVRTGSRVLTLRGAEGHLLHREGHRGWRLPAVFGAGRMRLAVGTDLRAYDLEAGKSPWSRSTGYCQRLVPEGLWTRHDDYEEGTEISQWRLHDLASGKLIRTVPPDEDTDLECPQALAYLEGDLRLDLDEPHLALRKGDATRWRSEAPFPDADPWNTRLTPDLALVASETTLTAVSLKTGATLWAAPLTGPWAAGKHGAYMASGSTVTLLSAADGRPRTVLELPTPITGFAGYPGRLFVLTDTTLRAYDEPPPR